MMKRLWVMALLLTLALSLTSCSSKKQFSGGQDYGYTFCQGTLGTFDVYVIPSKADPTLYELSIIPVQLDAPGDIVQVSVASQSLSYRQMLPQVVVQEGEEIFGGNLTDNDLNTFNMLAITPFDPSNNFLQSNSEKETICNLPQPGDTGD